MYRCSLMWEKRKGKFSFLHPTPPTHHFSPCTDAVCSERKEKKKADYKKGWLWGYFLFIQPHRQAHHFSPCTDVVCCKRKKKKVGCVGYFPHPTPAAHVKFISHPIISKLIFIWISQNLRLCVTIKKKLNRSDHKLITSGDKVC